jgi:ribosomal protein S18 acetylase RimI-like enzyme
VTLAPDLPGLRAFAPPDLPRVLVFVGECCAMTDFSGCFHPGDIGHFISSTLRGRDPSQHLFFTEAGNGQINALVWIYPARISGFEVMIHPNQRGGDLETRLIEWAENAVIALLQAESADSKEISTEVMDGDLARISALKQRGFEPEAQPSMMFTMRLLDVPIAVPVLPEGFSIRPVAGEDEAALVAEAHSSAFHSNRTPEDYLKIMRSPAFDIQHELVVVVPDGRFAAFTVVWFDPVSQSGLFEPVGCHADFQRMGLTRALMYEGMRRMVAQGMKTAAVVHETDNPASAGLYASVGFTPKYTITSFRKIIQA